MEINEKELDSLLEKYRSIRLRATTSPAEVYNIYFDEMVVIFTKLHLFSMKERMKNKIEKKITIESEDDENESNSRMMEKCVRVVKVIFQTLANSVSAIRSTENDNSKELLLMWNKLFPEFCKQMLQFSLDCASGFITGNKESGMFEPLTMMLYNFITSSNKNEEGNDVQQRPKQIATQREIVQLLLRSCSLHDSNDNSTSTSGFNIDLEWVIMIITQIAENYPNELVLSSSPIIESTNFVPSTAEQLILIKLVADQELHNIPLSFLSEMLKWFVESSKKTISPSQAEDEIFYLFRKECLDALIHTVSEVSTKKELVFERDEAKEILQHLLFFLGLPNSKGLYTLFLSGTKTWIMKSIANLCFQERENQQIVLHYENGLYSILNQTNIDDNNPLLREWTIFAIRNLCENNLEVQEKINSLRAQGVVNAPLIEKAGMKVDFDQSTGKTSVVPKKEM